MPVPYDVTMLCSQVTWEPVQHLLLREGKELTAECFLHSFEIDRTDMTPTGDGENVDGPFDRCW